MSRSKIWAMQSSSSALTVSTSTGVTTTVPSTPTNQFIGVSQAVAASVVLPAASSMGGYEITVKDEGGNASSFTITVAASQNIDSALSYKMTVKFQANTFFSDGAQWWVV